MNLFASLELGRRALFAARTSLDVAGSNIANINTPGYTRRRVELAETPSLFLGRFFVGSGVDAVRVGRVVDGLLEAQVRGEQENIGRREAASGGLSQIEELVGESAGRGISTALSGFFSAFSGLAASAGDPALRRDVAARADALASVIRDRAKGLVEFRRQADASATGVLARVGVLSSEIADLNRKIQQAEPGAGEAGDLRDARSRALRELSGLVDIKVAEGSRGTINVSFAATGDALVLESGAQAPVVTKDSSGLARIKVSRGGALVDITDRIRGGTLGALLAVRDETAKASLADLDTLASDLIARVNTLHAAGKDASGNTGGDFFTPTAAGASAAATLTVSAAILADPGLIAAGTTGSAGDGGNALAIAGLERATSAALGGNTAAGFLASLQTRIGVEARTASSALETGQAALLAAEGRLQALSGVDLDEEAAALIQYQRSYEAAAKFIATVNDLTKTALEMFTP